MEKIPAEKSPILEESYKDDKIQHCVHLILYVFMTVVQNTLLPTLIGKIKPSTAS